MFSKKILIYKHFKNVIFLNTSSTRNINYVLMMDLKVLNKIITIISDIFLTN